MMTSAYEDATKEAGAVYWAKRQYRLIKDRKQLAATCSDKLDRWIKSKIKGPHDDDSIQPETEAASRLRPWSPFPSRSFQDSDRLLKSHTGKEEDMEMETISE